MNFISQSPLVSSGNTVSEINVANRHNSKYLCEYILGDCELKFIRRKLNFQPRQIDKRRTFSSRPSETSTISLLNYVCKVPNAHTLKWYRAYSIPKSRNRNFYRSQKPASFRVALLPLKWSSFAAGSKDDLKS